jgi:hypothetical protein
MLFKENPMIKLIQAFLLAPIKTEREPKLGEAN